MNYTFDVSFNSIFEKNPTTGNMTDTSRCVYKVAPPIQNLDNKYEMALISIETAYSFPNITEGVNNAFGYKTTPNGATNIIYLSTGSYEITAIANAIQQQVGDAVYNNMQLIADEPTLKAMFKLDANYRIDFTIPNSINNILGFDQRIVGGAAGYYKGDRIVDILTVSSVIINCDIIDGTYGIDGKPGTGIYSFFPDVSPGFKINKSLSSLQYYRVKMNIIDRFTVWLTDQEGNTLNFRGETVTLRFHMRRLITQEVHDLIKF